MTVYRPVLSRLEQQRFTISEVAADWHELMIPWRIMRSSVARDGEQLDNLSTEKAYLWRYSADLLSTFCAE